MKVNRFGLAYVIVLPIGFGVWVGAILGGATHRLDLAGVCGVGFGGFLWAHFQLVWRFRKGEWLSWREPHSR